MFLRISTRWNEQCNWTLGWVEMEVPLRIAIPDFTPDGEYLYLWPEPNLAWEAYVHACGI